MFPDDIFLLSQLRLKISPYLIDLIHTRLMQATSIGLRGRSFTCDIMQASKYVMGTTCAFKILQPHSDLLWVELFHNLHDKTGHHSFTSIISVEHNNWPYVIGLTLKGMTLKGVALISMKSHKRSFLHINTPTFQIHLYPLPLYKMSLKIVSIVYILIFRGGKFDRFNKNGTLAYILLNHFFLIELDTYSNNIGFVIIFHIFATY